MGLVGEALEPSGVGGVGTPSMGNPMRAHAAVGEPHQVEPRCTRGKGEVSDPDIVSVGNAIAMSLQSIERTPKQSGRYLPVGSFCSSKSGLSSRGPRGQAGKSNLDKKTARIYQDVEFRCR